MRKQRDCQKKEILFMENHVLFFVFSSKFGHSFQSLRNVLTERKQQDRDQERVKRGRVVGDRL
jgi:hypothetical protein